MKKVKVEMRMIGRKDGEREQEVRMEGRDKKQNRKVKEKKWKE